MARFPADFYIQSLQGRKKLLPGQVRKILARRAAWIERKLAERYGADGNDGRFLRDELSAIAQLVELLPAKEGND